jgi:hypothetical protein
MFSFYKYVVIVWSYFTCVRSFMYLNSTQIDRSLAKATKDEVWNTQEELRHAAVKRQKEVQYSKQRATEFQRNLVVFTDRVVVM